MRLTRLACCVLTLLATTLPLMADDSWVPKGWKVTSPQGWNVPLPKKSELEDRQELKFNNGAEPQTLDPHLMTGVPEHTLATALFEGLTTPHPKTLVPMPGMAQAWAISPDGKQYRFYIRKGAMWSNGDPLTAKDFLESWKRVLEPKTACDYAYQLYYIEGAKAFNQSKNKDFSKVGVKVIAQHILEVTLIAPTPFFLELTYFETLMPVHLKTVNKALAEKKPWATPERMVCNGPYLLAEHKVRQRIVFKPNPKYWNAKRVILQKITALPLDDQNAVMNKYLAEEVDWIRSVPATRIDEAKKHPEYFVQTYLGCYYYSFNVTKKPFNDPRVRRAFFLAVDRVRICREVLKGGQQPAYGYVPPGIPGYKGYVGPKYNPKKALALLAAAGYPRGNGFPVVELLYNTAESHKLVAEAIQDMWKKSLGVQVKLRNTEWKVYLDLVKNLGYKIARRGWIGDYADPNTFMDMWVKDGGNNNTGWHKPQYDKWIAEAGREADTTKRMAIFRKAEKLLLDELPILPIYHYVNQGFLSPTVGGWDENIRDLHPFQFMYMKKLEDD